VAVSCPLVCLGMAPLSQHQDRLSLGIMPAAENGRNKRTVPYILDGPS
jgi:hypothetical protein